MAEISSREKVFVGMSRQDYSTLGHCLSIPPEFERLDPVRILVLDPKRSSDPDYMESSRKRTSERHDVPIERLHIYKEVVKVEQIE